MHQLQKLNLIKILHTVIWLFYNVVIFYFAYSVWIFRIDAWTWICLGLILLEGIILLVFNKICPVTILARRYSHSEKDNFDIYLPNWLAKHNKLIYTTIVVVFTLLLVVRLVSR